MSKEELELLMIPDEDTGISKIEHFDAKQIMKSEKNKKKKRGKKNLKEGHDLQETFEVNLQDDRFKDVFESHHFAIDPTHPTFKKTKNMEKILEKKRASRKDLEPIPEQGSKVEMTKSQEPKLNSLVEAVSLYMSFWMTYSFCVGQAKVGSCPGKPQRKTPKDKLSLENAVLIFK